MALLDLSNASGFAVLLSFLGTSLAGSTHCLGMCGPILLALHTPGKTEQALYHGFRLIGYLAVGAIAGTLGKAIFHTEATQNIQIYLAYFTGAILIFSGARVILSRNPIGSEALGASKVSHALLRWALKLNSHGKTKSALVGLFSVLLPCGWLYTFVIAAVGLGSPLWAAIALFFFWLGTLPALSLGAWGIQKLSTKLSHRFGQVAKVCLGLLMLGLGIQAIQHHLGFHHTSNDDQLKHSEHSCH